MISTETRINVVSGVSQGILALSWLALALGSIGLIIFLAKPQIQLGTLYNTWRLVKWTSLGVGFGCLVALAAIDTLASPLSAYGATREELRSHKYSWPARIVGGTGLILVILFAAGLLPVPREVILVQGKWVATGVLSGSREVSSSAAATYLWRDFGLASLFLLLIIGLQFRWVSRKYLRTVRSTIRRR